MVLRDSLAMLTWVFVLTLSGVSDAGGDEEEKPSTMKTVVALSRGRRRGGGSFFKVQCGVGERVHGEEKVGCYEGCF